MRIERKQISTPIKTAGALALLLILAFNVYNFIGNGHVHKIGDVVVFHSHPFLPGESESGNQKSHKHKFDEIFIYDQIFNPDITETCPIDESFLPVTGIIESCNYDYSVEVRIVSSISGRSPPEIS